MKCYRVNQGHGKATPWSACVALAYRSTLHAAHEYAAEGAVTACHDDTYRQGCEDAVIAEATHITSRHTFQRSKTLVFCTAQARLNMSP